MIHKEEIDSKSKEFEISTVNVEKDYVYGWVLNSIYKHSSLKEHLILKGGNGLRKSYLPNTRFSKDLDFSVKESLEVEFLHNELQKICEFINQQTSILFELERTQVKPKNIPFPDKDILEAKLYFKGFYGEESISLKTQLDITQFDKIYLPVQSRKLIHPYSDSDLCDANINVHKAEEILASKLNSLLHRQKVSDLFDLLHAIIFTSDFQVNRTEVITTFLKKSIFESTPSSAKEELLKVDLNAYEPFWNTLVAPVTSIIKFDVVAENFRNLIDSLFNLVSTPRPIPAYKGSSGSGRAGSYYQSRPSNFISSPRYFSSDTRNTIIRAGKSRTMVQMLYDGYSRLVEPYSMKYEVRKDGVGMEYFWGYDTSGGKSNQQSIKRFICDKIQSAENTDYTFVPQYAVEF